METTLKIADLLRKNCREHMTFLAEELGMATSTFFEKSKKAGKLITRYYSEVDFEKLGFPIHAFAIVERDNCIIESPAVNNAYLLADKRVLVEVLFKRLSDCPLPIDKMFFAEEKVKSEDFLLAKNDWKTF